MVNELNLRILPQQAYNEQSILAYLRQEKGINAKAVRVVKRSIDARQRTIFVNLTVRAYVGEEPPLQDFEPYIYKDVSERPSVIVVGAGPGGLFAALRLIELGLKPIVIERGKDVRERKKDIARIRPEQRIDPESNYCFGEGGAGAYSDGKLYTRSKKRGNTDRILQIFVQHGASPAILSDAHPHIGTDRLPRVIENMRNTILRCGGEVHFQTKMTGFLIENSRLNIERRVVGIEVMRQDNSQSSIFNIQSSAVILATGHSARDVYRYLAESGIDIEAKGLAIGVRLEHPAELIDQIQYHSKQGRGKWLPAAEYSMVTQVQGRGVYSFCMCPGGFVVPAASGPEQVVVNGMSPSNRNGRWSNSGMVVEIRPEDYKEFKIDKFKIQNSHPLGGDEGSFLPLTGELEGVFLQEELERQCWLQANRLQTAPASTRLREAFKLWGKQKHGFLTSEATVIGIETRTSSPVRILRDGETLQHIRVEGLFPCGEGAGYAGGIVSAGVDGERCAEAVANYLTKQSTTLLSC